MKKSITGALAGSLLTATAAASEWQGEAELGWVLTSGQVSPREALQ